MDEALKPCSTSCLCPPIHVCPQRWKAYRWTRTLSKEPTAPPKNPVRLGPERTENGLGTIDLDLSFLDMISMEWLISFFMEGVRESVDR